ncbi:MAG TPA: hypothetical protein VK338_00115, partial [Candidatus Nitrosocosmicus sp.]|nr:hypothetical protein [Candidatus Nitrosocosmicus sp.]
MLSIDFIRENKEKVAEAAKNKNRNVEIDKIIDLDDKRRVCIGKIQQLREERNSVSKEKPSEEIIERGKKIKEELKILEENLTNIEKELNTLLSYVPNVPLDEVPMGKDEANNVEIKKVGTIPQFDFTPKSHIELGIDLDLFDLERGTKVSGFRGYFLKNEGAILHFA